MGSFVIKTAVLMIIQLLEGGVNSNRLKDVGFLWLPLKYVVKNYIWPVFFFLVKISCLLERRTRDMGKIGKKRVGDRTP